DRKPRALSGGQRQRVAMGRAIVRNPNVFLFDEPLSNLDAKLRVQMRSEIKELHERLKTTTIYVTHDQIEAMMLADRAVVMNGGVIEQEGHPLELYDRPKSLFVAAFIGSPPMNFLEGRVEGGSTLVLDNGERLNCPGVVLGASRRVTVGVRPEHFSIGCEGWPAAVAVVEPTGSESQITARISGKLIRVLVRGRTDVRPGQTIHLIPDRDRVHVFDGDAAAIVGVGDPDALTELPAA
ncbi:MAG: TOBE domain-containing protein, partial [Oxalobacteraceae bacterium]